MERIHPGMGAFKSQEELEFLKEMLISMLITA